MKIGFRSYLQYRDRLDQRLGVEFTWGTDHELRREIQLFVRDQVGITIGLNGYYLRIAEPQDEEEGDENLVNLHYSVSKKMSRSKAEHGTANHEEALDTSRRGITAVL